MPSLAFPGRQAARVLVLLLVGSLAGPTALASAQSPTLARPPSPVTRAPRHATLDMATGVLTRDADDKAVSLTTVFANTDFSGFYGVSSSAGEEWLDWGSIGTTSGSAIVGSFQFAYGTSALATTIGPGIFLCANFYAGATGWCAESGLGIVPDAQFCFSGLPGATSSTYAWIVTVNLVGGYEFELPRGPFGFGMTFFDTLTGPLLCYAGSPAGGFDAEGQEDAFDIYVPDVATGTCGTYWFGGVPSNFSSWWLEIAKADRSGGPLALCSWYCGSGVNANGFTVVSAPVLGETFTTSVTAASGNIGAFLAAYASPLTVATSWGELLVNVADPAGELLGFPVALGNPAVISMNVPINLTLGGLQFFVQAVGFRTPITLHCAYACTVGF